MNTCPFCSKTYSNKYILTRHIQTSKKCIDIRNKPKNGLDNSDINEDIILYQCSYCLNAEYTREDSLSRHYNKCWAYWKEKAENIEKVEIKLSEEYEWKLIELEETIQTMKKEISELRNRPTTVNIDNRTINNTQNLYIHPVTKDRLENQSRHLSLQHIDCGATGYAKYAVEYPLKDSVKCSDYLGRKLTKEFFQSIREETAQKAGQRLFSSEVLAIPEDERMNYQCKLQQIVRDVNSAANGEKTTFTQDWVNELCSLVRI